jgi:hypothetical protein
MLEVHAAALETINEAYHNFLLKYNRTKKMVYGFVEGKDDPSFYRSVIERFLPDDWGIDLIRAGNRDKVLEVERSFDWQRFSREQIAFFIDRDLTKFTKANETYEQNIYVTDGYSIENDIATSDVALRLLSEIHNIVDWTDDERQALAQHFNNQLDIFCEMMTPVMCQILWWRVQGASANLNNLDLPSIFHFVEGSLTTRPEFNTEGLRIDRLCACVGAARAEDVDRDKMKLAFDEGQGPKKFVRGKYLIWFLAAFCNEVHKIIDVYVQAYSRPPKSKMSISPGNIIIVAAPRARIPASLRNFIDKTFSQFIATNAA